MALSVTGQGKYAKQTGGRGQYGHVMLLTLHDADTGVLVMNRLADGAIRGRTIHAKEAPITMASAMNCGSVTGRR